MVGARKNNEKKGDHESVDEVIKEYNTDLNKGLSQYEVMKRLKQYGYNEIQEKKVSPILKFLSYFWGPMPWMIEAAAILSIVVKHWVDFALISLLLFVNAIIGFVEEYKAANVIEYLKKKMALKAKVLRDGEWRVIEARELVPGDVVRLRIGDIVPGDAIIVRGEYVMVDESALTGESQPLEKTVGEKLYSGSVIKRGEVDVVITATASYTYFGKTVEMVKSVKEKSTTQRLVTRIADYLIVIAMFLILIILIDSVYSGQKLIETIRFSLVLLISSIPVAMPAVLSVIMARGAYVLAKKQALVTKLTSIEELASIDILCCDKTGTLTQNKLKLGEVYTLGDFNEEEVILYASLASRKEDNDPIDLAILDKAEDMDLESKLKKFKVIKFTPFDPVIKRTEAIVEVDGERITVAKGAPQIIAELCSLDTQSMNKLNKKIDEFANKGYRSLGVGIKRGDSWSFVGLLSMYDPPRPDSYNMIQKIKSLGIKVKMITGDHIAIAKTIAAMLGIGNKIVSMKELLKLKKKEDLTEIIENADGFSEVFPEHKFKVVESLQRKGHFVGMTGDGINDVPALKKANCGIAVSGATDAARAAADIVLLRPGLSVIYDAVREARRIFQRMKGYVIYRITETIRILLFMTLSILVFHFYPMTVIMLILLILLNDIPILSLAYDNVVEEDKPQKFNIKEILIISTVLGVVGVISSFMIYFYAVKYMKLSLAMIQTFVFLKLVIAGHRTLFITRIREQQWKRPYPSKQVLLAVLSTDLIATVFAAEGILVKAIGWKLVGILWLYVIVWAIISDYIKIYLFKKIG